MTTRVRTAMRWWLALLGGALILLHAAETPAQRTIVLDTIKITVNNKSLTQREVQQFHDLQAEELKRQYEGDALQEQLRGLSRRLTETLVEDLLIESHAERLNITVTDQTLDERVDNIVRRQPNLQDLYSDEQLKAFVLKDLLRRRVLSREVDARVFVSAADIVAACRASSQDSREIEVGHILLRGDESAAQTRLEELRERLLAGESFEALATEFSQDPSVTENKGRLGFISRGQFVKPFEDAAFALPVGALSDPVRTRFGLHLIKVFDQRSKGAVDCDKLDPVAKQGIENRIYAERRQHELESFLARLKRQADIRVFE